MMEAPKTSNIKTVLFILRTIDKEGRKLLWWGHVLMHVIQAKQDKRRRALHSVRKGVQELKVTPLVLPLLNKVISGAKVIILDS
jgi:hypothetical protein